MPGGSGGDSPCPRRGHRRRSCAGRWYAARAPTPALRFGWESLWRCPAFLHLLAPERHRLPHPLLLVANVAHALRHVAQCQVIRHLRSPPAQRLARMKNGSLRAGQVSCDLKGRGGLGPVLRQPRPDARRAWSALANRRRFSSSSASPCRGSPLAARLTPRHL